MDSGAKESSVELRGILIGKAGDEFVDYAESVFEDFNISYAFCEDVYAGSAELGRASAGRVLAVGRFEDLNKEGGRFFELAAAKGVLCCCFVETETMFGRKGLFKAAQAGTLVLQKPAQIEQVISKLLTRAVGGKLTRQANGDASGVIRNEFQISDEELRALLGTEVDETSEYGE